MKKVLIVINNMNIGGIQKALLNLLNNINKIYDITLLCINPSGDYMQHIPNRVHVIQGNQYAQLSEETFAEARKKGLLFGLLRAALSSWCKLFGKQFPAYLVTRKVGVIDGQYDVAISFCQPINDKAFCVLTNEIVLECCDAKRKVTFVHCDFGAYGGNTKYNRNLYKKFDKIAVVSDSVGRIFISLNPDLSDRVYTVRNCCNIEEIRQLADQEPQQYRKTAIITIARLSPEKGLLRCIPILDKLKLKGYSFEWHIIGGGLLKDELNKLIYDSNLENEVILHGEQANPYPFLRYADYFFLPSFHEAAPIVFDEALCLRVPILTTRTLSADELVHAQFTGLVCDNDDESIYKMLENALSGKVAFVITKNDVPNNELPIMQFNAIINESSIS